MLSIGCCRGICLRIDSDLFAFEGDSVVVCRNTRCPHWGISIRTPSALGEQMLCYFDHVPRFKSVTLNVFGRGRGFRNACSQLTRRRVRSSTALCSSPPPQVPHPPPHTQLRDSSTARLHWPTPRSSTQLSRRACTRLPGRTTSQMRYTDAARTYCSLT